MKHSAPTASLLRDSDVFYCATGDVFDGMLIRRHRKSAGEHELKVYAGSRPQLAAFVRCLRDYGGPASVDVNDDNDEEDPVRLLGDRIADEMQFVRTFDYAAAMKQTSTADAAAAFLRQRARFELRTDLAVQRIETALRDRTMAK